MQNRCNDQYWEHMQPMLARNGDPQNPGKPCGRLFDDVNQSTICPHEPLGTEGLVCRRTDLYVGQCKCGDHARS